jgi:hypothetical protein
MFPILLHLTARIPLFNSCEAEHPTPLLYNSCMPQISDQATVLLLVDFLADIPSNFQVYEPVELIAR